MKFMGMPQDVQLSTYFQFSSYDPTNAERRGREKKRHVSLRAVEALNGASMVKHLEIESHRGDDPRTKNSRAP